MISPEALEALESFLEREDNNNESNTENNTETIPVNSATALLNENTSRFSGAPWYEEIKKQRILVAGAGGISSWLLLFLSRLNPQSIITYDFDKVELVNMAGQLYRDIDINTFKVDAINHTCREYSNYYKMISYRNRITSDTNFNYPHTFVGLDNMQGRKTIYYKWKSLVSNHTKKDEFIFIDGRLTANMFQIFAFTGDDKTSMNKYEADWLFNDSEALELPCSFKQTSHIAAMIASVMTNIYVNYIAKIGCGIEYTIPFLTTYNADMMNFNIEL